MKHHTKDPVERAHHVAIHEANNLSRRNHSWSGWFDVYENVYGDAVKEMVKQFSEGECYAENPHQGIG